MGSWYKSDDTIFPQVKIFFFRCQRNTIFRFFRDALSFLYFVFLSLIMNVPVTFLLSPPPSPSPQLYIPVFHLHNPLRFTTSSNPVTYCFHPGCGERQNCMEQKIETAARDAKSEAERRTSCQIQREEDTWRAQRREGNRNGKSGSLPRWEIITNRQTDRYSSLCFPWKINTVSSEPIIELNQTETLLAPMRQWNIWDN